MIPLFLAELEQSPLAWRSMPVPYSTLMRWRARARAGQNVCQKPGPKKQCPLPTEQVEQAVRKLDHAQARTAGTQALYQELKEWVSRRDLQNLVAEVRAQKQAEMKRVQWLHPNLAWSIDATEVTGGFKIIPVKDLASRYLFTPHVSPRESGVEIAQYLEILFQEHGAPLFLKRDNGSSFNHHEVDAVLNRYGVLPLNNPPHYPRYNGAMERAIQELKLALENNLLAHCPEWIRETVEQINHRPRRCLGGQCAADWFYRAAKIPAFSREKREQLFRLLHLSYWKSIGENNVSDHRQLARLGRAAAENWLVRQNLIRIRYGKNNPVSPHFPKNWSHN